MERSTIREQVLREYLTEGVGVRTLAERYDYHFTTIARWIVKGMKNREERVITSGDQEPANKTNRIHELPAEIPSDVSGLQEALRLAHIKIALLEATIDIADEQFGADIRKKAGARQS